MIEKFLTDISRKKQSFDKITSISFEAMEFKKTYPDKKIINGTIGMFYDNEEKPYVFPIIKEISNDITLNDISTYGPLYPTEKFTEGVFNLLKLDKKFKKYCTVFPTSGGLNALHHFIHNFVDKTTSVYSFEPYWGPYENILGEVGYRVNTIKLEKNKDFILKEDLITNNIIQDKNKKIVFIINIPCQNPTGFTPDSNELLELKESIKQLQSEGKEILLFFDLVYIHYSKLNINKIFEIFSDFPFFFNFSSSKTLSLYGFRAGCLCLYSKIEEDLKLFPEKIAFSARASTGSINHYGYNIIEKFSNNSNIFELETSWEFVKTNLRLRADKLVAIFNAHDIEYYRYDEGFFFSFYSKKCDINLLFNKLKENGIFFIPQKETIRVAISSISIDKLDELEKRFDILL